MKKFICTLISGSFSLAELMAEMFASTKYAYTTLHQAMLDEQLVSINLETKFQIPKRREDRMVKFGTEGSAFGV
jgi:hypothetical protein